MSVTTEGTTLFSATVLTAAYQTADLGCAGSDEAIFCVNYTKGDEVTGLHYKIEWVGPDGVAYPLGTDAASPGIWVPTGDQRIDKPAGASVAMAIRVTTPGLRLRFGIKANGAITNAGNVTVLGFGVGARG